jgi:hypothetical protein
VLAVVLALSVTAGCGGGSHLDISAKRENLDLAYRNEKLAKKPATVIELLDDAPPVPGLPSSAATIAVPRASFRLPPPDPPCRSAPADVPASSQTTSSATAAPPVGSYPAHQVGTFAIKAGTFDLKGPVAPETEIQIRNVVDDSSVDSSGKTQPNIAFDEVVPGFNAPTVTTYKITATELQLVKIVTGDDTFAPTPSITIMKFADAVGTSWTSAGVDVDTTEAMTVQGTIEARERVDLCGTVVEAYRISSDERRVNTQTGYSYETDSAQPKIYDIATQAGALTIRIREKSTTSFVANGTPGTVDLDYTRTLNAVRPRGSA